MRFIALTLLLLAGCAGEPIAGGDAGRLALLTTLTIPPESATLRLQYGRPVARNAVQEQDPFCVFEINTVSDSPQTVRPDTLRVTRISRGIATIVDASAPPHPLLMKASLNNDDRPTHIYYKTLFHLHSERQPGVRLLTCMSNQNLPGVYPFMRHLTLAEMREALGTGFRLEPR
ncbi:MAG: hypothetical protein Q8O33_12435 [Pseudomonadota bacterium]|nr:hypothetical protein [Pseudomonadota bacterium]